jgi:hypothetical protein
LSLAPPPSTGQKDSQAVVLEAPKSPSGPLHLLDQQVHRLNGTIRSAGGVVGEDLGSPTPQELGQPA